MNIHFICEQILHMKPSCFSPGEQQRFRAEKMLMRQFMLMKLKCQVPSYLCVEDMKDWLLGGRSFLEDFQVIKRGADARMLLVAELEWSSARCICVNQMEHELQEELKTERRLSTLFGRKVTLEGLQMFLSILRPKAEQDVRVSLRHLSNKLLNSFAGSLTGKCSKRALPAKLQRTTLTLAPQVVGTVLGSILEEPEPLVEFLGLRRSRVAAVCARTGEQLAEAAATCFCLCLSVSYAKARLLQSCTSAAQDMVKAVCRRFVECSKTFHLLDFDESFIIAREGVIYAIEDMEDRVQTAAYSSLRRN